MLQLGQRKFTSRLLLGTAQYPSPEILLQAIEKSQTEIITVALRRHNPTLGKHKFWDFLKSISCEILPNTAGCFSAKEAITTAQMARELFETHWIKLEVIGDDYTLQPNPFELVVAAEQLVKEGFEVFPYCTEDLILCQRLVNAGCKVLMPWGAPIGSGKGLLNLCGLKLLRQRFSEITLIIDAGIGKPSHAIQAMELGFDAVLLNTAVALAVDPVQMADAFSRAVIAGHLAYKAGVMPSRDMAHASTPLVGRPFWQKEEK